MGDYPSKAELSYYEKEQVNEEFIDELFGSWWASDWGLHITEGVLHMSTGGWSGNEEIIDSLRRNEEFWKRLIEKKAGGHYTFDVKDLNLEDYKWI